ncbi:MAG: protein rep [Bifidobacterium mongoliense]|nr:protein rep [Bifidobacterium mongoliense]
MAERRLELGVLMSTCVTRGYGLAFGAFTLRHRRGDDLGVMLAGLSYCWDRMMRARSVRRLLEAMGFVGYVRALEVMVSPLTGWHPHLHPLFIFAGEVTPDAVACLWVEMFRVWLLSADRRGLRAPVLAAQHLHVVTDPARDLSDYLTKATADATFTDARSVEWEMTSSETKKGRRTLSRSPWQVLDDLAHYGEVADMAIWHEYEAATKGKRSITYSKAARALLPATERTDEEIANEEVGDVDDTLFYITDWSVVVEHPEWGAGILSAVEHGGLDAGLAYCGERGIPVAQIEKGEDDDE